MKIERQRLSRLEIAKLCRQRRGLRRAAIPQEEQGEDIAGRDGRADEAGATNGRLALSHVAAALFPSFCVGWFAARPRRRGWRAAWRRSSGCKKRLPLVAPEETKTLREFETTGIAMRRCATEQHALDEEVQRVRALLHFNVLREMS